MACTVAFKPIDPKRDEFRKYLERAGVIEALTKVVIRIVKERPENPLEYLRANLCDAKHEADEYAYLKRELEEARGEIKRLREVIAAADPNALSNEKSSATTNNDVQKPVAADSSAEPEEENVVKEAENKENEHEKSEATTTDNVEEIKN